MKTKEQRQQEAKVRQAEYDKLTDEQKYQRAVERGHSGSREAIRLRKKIDQKVDNVAIEVKADDKVSEKRFGRRPVPVQAH